MGSKPDANYFNGMARWYAEGHYSDEVHEWLVKAAIEGDPERLYQSAWKSRGSWQYGELNQQRRMLLSAAVKGHAKACMALCSLEFEEENPDWGFNWYRRGRELGRPHDVEAVCDIEYPPLTDSDYPQEAEDFNSFLRQKVEAVGRSPEEHIGAYVWLSDAYNHRLWRLSTVLEPSEIDEAEILLKEYWDFLKTRPKREEVDVKGV